MRRASTDAAQRCAGSIEGWRHTIAVDLSLCAQRAARRMVEQGAADGRIVNFTSVHEHTPIIGNSAYTAAKYGLGGLTKQLALELGQYGITVNSVAPGMVATPMTGSGTKIRQVTRSRSIQSRGPATLVRSRVASHGFVHLTQPGRPARRSS